MSLLFATRPPGFALGFSSGFASEVPIPPMAQTEARAILPLQVFNWLIQSRIGKESNS